MDFETEDYESATENVMLAITAKGFFVISLRDCYAFMAEYNAGVDVQHTRMACGSGIQKAAGAKITW
ncbi:hypothetical protein [Lacrimispora sp.]|uniref:hypothetical protein n=1 Tax=Lacrimispora sp. TaxID=2719234 RepID=UPI0028A10EBD|nr:hypothetical protein [Lacrimispora sp.]